VNETRSDCFEKPRSQINANDHTINFYTFHVIAIAIIILLLLLLLLLLFILLCLTRRIFIILLLCLQVITSTANRGSIINVVNFFSILRKICMEKILVIITAVGCGTAISPTNYFLTVFSVAACFRITIIIRDNSYYTPQTNTLSNGFLALVCANDMTDFTT